MPKKKKTKKKAVKKKTTKKKKAAATLVSLLLDESGSMISCKPQTISGFNEYLLGLGDKKHGEVLFTFTKFNTERTQVVYAGEAVSKIAKLTDSNYSPSAGTPLLDAIGKTIASVEASLNNRKDKPTVLVIIMTDGQENSSHEYNNLTITKLIEEKKKAGWTFVFLGAGQDAIASASSIGISAGYASTYTSTHTDVTMRNLSAATTRIRGAVAGGQHIANAGTFFTKAESLSNKHGEPAGKKDEEVKKKTVTTS